MKVQSSICIYEVNGKDIPLSSPNPELIIKSHWNNDRLIILKFGDRKEDITVSGSDLRKAIEQCTYWRF